MTEPQNEKDASAEAEKKAEAKAAPAPEIRTVEGSKHAPIVGEHHFGRFHIFHRRTPMRPWVARVFVLGNGRIVEFGRDKQPTTGELLWGGYRAMYEVDLALHRLGLEITLPSSGDEFVFRAVADVQWRVSDPKLVVRCGITDIRDVMVPELLDGLRKSTRSLLATDVELAEKSANGLFSHNWLTETYGLWTRVLVRLRLDEQKEENARLAADVQAYKVLISAGDLDQFALQLARNPENVDEVVQQLVRERDTHRRDVCDFLTKLLASDALDRWQIDDQVRVLLQWMDTSISRVLTGTDTARPDPFSETPYRLRAGGETGGT
jgi:hypothetical protein